VLAGYGIIAIDAFLGLTSALGAE